MKSHPPPALSEKEPHERFLELGTKLLAVPKTVIDARDKKWQARKKAKRKKS